ncbi:MAG: peptidylprolyl isomerase [Cyanobacteria bacterium J06621_11]
MVTFSGIDIGAEELIDILRRDLQFNEVAERALSLRIIHTESAHRHIEVKDTELQAESERIRRELKLESAQKTMDWLNEQNLSADEWEEGIRDHILTGKLADAMFKDAAQTHFIQNKLDYEQASLYRVIVPTAQIAQELIYQIEENEINFFEAAHLYDVDPLRRAYCGYEGNVSRWSLDPDIAASVFGSEPLTVIGPCALQEGHALFFVDSFMTPEFTDEIYQEIRDHKFREWLAAEIQRLSP